MRRLILPVVFAALMAAATSVAQAQAEAQQAFEKATAAYQAGDFAAARDLAQQAATTDPNNPEVHLLLGRAHYELGEIQAAADAWAQTLKLAPEQPLAAKMLAAVRAERADADAQIALVESMIRETLYVPALDQCKTLLAKKALSEAQRARLLTLQAEALVRTAQHAEAQKVLQQVLVLYPKQADPIQTTLLLGEAKLHAGGDSLAEGLALLRKVAADHVGTPAAAEALYELTAFDLKQGTTELRAEAMAAWLTAYAQHRRAGDAREALLHAYLALSLAIGRPTPDVPLGPYDVKALKLVTEMLGQTAQAERAQKLVGTMLDHLQSRYANQGAETAAIAGVETLLAAPLPRPSRLLALKAQAQYKTTMEIGRLDELARSGGLPPTAAEGDLPAGLAEIVSIYALIAKEYPAEPAWDAQVALAAEVRARAPLVRVSGTPKELKSADAWAVAIAMPTLQTRPYAVNTKAVVDLVQGIIRDYASVDDPAARQAAVALSARLLAGVVPADPTWPGVIDAHAQLLGSYATYLFNENLKSGNAEKNASLSEPQKQLLATLQTHVARDAGRAAAALDQLRNHAQPWIKQGHWAVAEELYTTLAKSLPATEQRRANLAVASLWIQQVTEEHARLTATGLSVPEKLDPRFEKALARCYELQAGLEPDSGVFKVVRVVADGVVAHYKALTYYDVAEAAIRVKGPQPVDAADQRAALDLAQLHEEQARRELSRRLNSYGAREKLVLGPAFEEVISELKKFMSDRPTSPLVTEAASRLIGIAQHFEQQGAHDVAIGIYGDLAKFTAGVPSLAESSPGLPSVAQRMAFSVASALDAKAGAALDKQQSQRKPEDAPPEKLSDEYAAALRANLEFARTYEDSPLAGVALRRARMIALRYAQIDAWDVADSVYAELLESKLAIRQSERLKFARGVCQLGRAMPDHARQVLSALTTAGPSGPDDDRGEMLARLYGSRSSAVSGTELQMTLDRLAASPAGGPAPADTANLQFNADQSVSISGYDRRSGEGMGGGGMGGGTMGGVNAHEVPLPTQPTAEANRDSQLLAMIRQQESNRAAQIAQLREVQPQYTARQQADNQQQSQQGQLVVAAPVLSEAELKRQATALAAAYEIFQAIRADHPDTPTADQSRGEILVMIGHWRSLQQWDRSAALAVRFLADNPADRELPRLRLEIARDRLAWASKPLPRETSKQAMLAEVSRRFEAARDDLTAIVTDFPKEGDYAETAQWDVATSFLTQARVVDAFSPTLAQGQYVRAGKELRAVALKYPTHPRIGEIPQMLWTISNELTGRGYDEEAIVIFNELAIYDPMQPLAQQASVQIANLYRQKLKRPLLAAEAYQELYFAQGGGNQGLLDSIFQIGSELKNEKRYVEALHVLGTFVDSAPRHPQAGSALTMVGQIHQANEAWEDAIAAYRRVIGEYQDGQFVQEAKWSIAECTINLSQWHEASDAYAEFVKTYPQDGRVAEANRRIEVLKDLARYQGLVDEEGQRRAADAQYQIAVIVGSQLSNPVKAIIEYRKVVANWPESHLADDALYAVGTSYLSLDNAEKAREALLAVAEKYPTSTLADDALFMVGNSYEREVARLSTVTRSDALARNQEEAQKKAYQTSRGQNAIRVIEQSGRIAELKAEGKGAAVAAEEASQAFNFGQFNDANVRLLASQAAKEVETQTAVQLADRQDKINAALRKAVETYAGAAKIAGADKADEALLQMATIYDQQLKDAKAAVATWLEITRQFSGTAVAEDASWRLAQYYERETKYTEAVAAYEEFVRKYRSSPNAGGAQFAIAENYEQLGQWVKAMDSYANYVNNFPNGPLVKKAQEQITWIKTYRL